MFYDRRIPFYQARLVVIVAVVTGLLVALDTWLDSVPPAEVAAWGAGAALVILALFALLAASQVWVRGRAYG